MTRIYLSARFLLAVSVILALTLTPLIQPANADQLAPQQAPPAEETGQFSAAPKFDAPNQRAEAVRLGKWPAQVAGSRGDIQPDQHGPQRNDPAEGIPAHAYSPFDERRNREYPCPPGGCDFGAGHVLVKLAPGVEVASPARQAGAQFTGEAVLDAALSSQGIVRLEPIFPNAEPPQPGEQIVAPDGQALPKPDLTRWYVGAIGESSADVYAVVEALAEAPGVVWAEPDYLRKPVGELAGTGAQGNSEELGELGKPERTPDFTDPLFEQQWHLAGANVLQAWQWLSDHSLPPGGDRDIVVAVIDTGVDYTHPDLAANMWVNAPEFNGVTGVDDDGNGYVDDKYGADTVTPDGNPQDDHGHGTHVAGIIAAQADNGIGGVGVAYNVQVMALKAAQYSGVLATSDIAEAIYYAVQKGADVINMSFGGYARSQVEEDALAVAFGQAVLVAAAGNDAKVNLPCPFGRDMYPAAYNWVLGVMASTQAGSRAGFSNFDCQPHDSHEYELMAPGMEIWSTLPQAQFAAWAGTSMAAPIVSGIAALARTRWSDRDVYSSRFIMGQIASNTSNGVANAHAALTQAPQPELSYLEHWLFDTATQNPINDDDGIVDAGETIDLAIVIRNHWGKADPVSVLLEPWAEGAFQPDPYVTMIVDTVDYGAVSSFNIDDNGLIYENDVIVGVSDPFRFSIAADTPNDHVIPFRLTISAGNGYDPADPNAPYTFVSRFNLIVQRGRELPRIISQDMTLTKDYLWLVSDASLIEAGVTVTVTTGTQVQFWSADPSDPYSQNAQPYVQVEGTLRVLGAEEEPVEFFSGAMYPGFAVRIERRNGGAIDLNYVRALNPWVYATSIAHCYFAQELFDAIYYRNELVNPQIDANLIVNTIFQKLGYQYRRFNVVNGLSNLYDSSYLNLTSHSLYDSVFLKNFKRYDLVSAAADSGYQIFTPNFLRTAFPTQYNGKIYVALARPGMDEDTYIYLAEEFANKLGGHVVAIDNAVENQFLFSYHNSSFNQANFNQSYPNMNCGDPNSGTLSDNCWGLFTGYFMIGLTDRDVEGQFRWLSGESLSYTNWEQGAPDNGNCPTCDEDIVFFNGLGQWADLPAIIGPLVLELPDLLTQTVLDQATAETEDSRLPNAQTQQQQSAHLEAAGRADGTFLLLDRSFAYGNERRVNQQTFEVEAQLEAARQQMIAMGPSFGFKNNAILNVWWDPDINHWMRFFMNKGRNWVGYLNHNWWGTANTTLIDAAIYDYNDDFNKGLYVFQPILTEPPETAYPFVTGVSLSTSAQPNATIVGAEPVTFTVKFNRDMNVTVQPVVSFGPDMPQTDYTVHAIGGGWVDPRTWQGTFNITPVTGDGYQFMRIAGARAADDPWLITGDDSERFRFEIITSGTNAMNLQGTGGEGYVDLMWTQTDFDLLAGFNLYKATSQAGPYTRLNSTLIPPEQRTWRDTTVVPGQPYYYKFTVVKTDMTESDYSNVATATPIDTIPPVIQHTPLISAAPGLGLTFFADVTDNVAVQSVTLFHRPLGASTYTSRPMVKTTGNRYSTTLPGSSVTAPGLEYYIEASDGISTVRSGRPEYPHQVVVSDRPTVTSVTPNLGPAGGGTAVTIVGSNFKPGATVTFGGAACGNVVVASSSQITCSTPPHYPIAVDVTVTNPGGQTGTMLQGYRYESDVVSMSLPSTSGPQHAVVEVPVNLANANGMVAASLTVTFDNAILRALGVSTGSLTPGWSVAADTGTPGEVQFSMITPGGSVTGSGALALLRFDVVGAPGAASTLHLANVSLNSGAIPVQTADGSFGVDQVYSVGGTVSFWNSGVVSDTLLTLAGNRLYTARSNATGVYTVGGAVPGAYTLTPDKSDEAKDIGSYDSSLALQHDAGLISLTGYAATAADVDRSGVIDAMDAYYIMQKSVDLIGLPFPGAGVVWSFAPSNRSYTNLSSNQTGQDFTAVLLGDVSGNWSPGSPPAPPEQLTASGALSLGDVLAAPGERITVALSAGLTQAQLYAADLAVTYDPAVLTFVSATPGAAASGFMTAANAGEPGRVSLALAGASPLTSGGVLFNLVFDAAGPAGSSTPLAFQRAELNEGQIATQAEDGSVDIQSGIRGDCNADTRVDAGDISATVLEIFDGDDSNPAAAPGGTFLGSGVGCNANQDATIDAGDISCTVLLIFNGPNACDGLLRVKAPSASESPGESPALSLLEPKLDGDRLIMPIGFKPGAHQISSVVFALDYDPTVAGIDPSDADGNGIPDAVALNLPPGFQAAVTVDNQTGYLQIMIADISTPLAALPKQVIAQVTWQVKGNPVEAATLRFAESIQASFGDMNGRSVPGS